MSRTIIDTEKWEDQSLNTDPGNLIKGEYRANSSDFLYFTRLNRAASMVELVRANTTTGKSEITFGEERVSLIELALYGCSDYRRREGVYMVE